MASGTFFNRIKELALLEEYKSSQLIVLYGRRRVGKTELIRKWTSGMQAYYTQAIEASESTQIEQICEDLRELLPEAIMAHNWKELFSLLSLITKECTLIIDEFPYLVKTQSSLPSQLQSWLDHKQPKHVKLVLLGSSQSMMHQIFLNSTSPLYERADLVLHIQPMEYMYFCQALDLNSSETNSLELYSLVGGIPRYWKYAYNIKDPIILAEKLYFSNDALLENEPDRLLKDEDINGMQAKTIFEIIGRGAHKSSEIATKMELHQTALSKPLKILMATSLITRLVPFGENPKNSKKTLYFINDVAMNFWYGSYSPHRSRWHLYDDEYKRKIIHDHASKILEKIYLNCYRDAAMYWESNFEFDCVRHLDGISNKIIISEIKHKHLTSQERKSLTLKIESNFQNSKLKNSFSLGGIEILDTKDVLQSKLIGRHK